eukprot:s1937_g13.t1
MRGCLPAVHYWRRSAAQDVTLMLMGDLPPGGEVVLKLVDSAPATLLACDQLTEAFIPTRLLSSLSVPASILDSTCNKGNGPGEIMNAHMSTGNAYMSTGNGPVRQLRHKMSRDSMSSDEASSDVCRVRMITRWAGSGSELKIRLSVMHGENATAVAVESRTELSGEVSNYAALQGEPEPQEDFKISARYYLTVAAELQQARLYPTGLAELRPSTFLITFQTAAESRRCSLLTEDPCLLLAAAGEMQCVPPVTRSSWSFFLAVDLWRALPTARATEELAVCACADRSWSSPFGAHLWTGPSSAESLPSCDLRLHRFQNLARLSSPSSQLLTASLRRVPGMADLTQFVEVSNRIPKAFRSAAAAPSRPARPRWTRPAPKVVPPPKSKRAAAAAEARQQAQGASSNGFRLGPQWVPPDLLERGMVVLCQDGALGVIESVFAALDEVHVQRHGSTEPVKLNTKQITFLGEWSDSVEIINSVEVPSDVESVLGLEQLDQLQDLAGKAPVHLESLPQEGACGALAQLVIGPSTAKAVKAAVDAIVSHVDGLDYPEGSYAKAASSVAVAGATGCQATPDQWPPAAVDSASALYPAGSPPVMMVCPVWPGSNPAWPDWSASPAWGSAISTVAASPAGPIQINLGSWQEEAHTVEVSLDTDQTLVQEIPLLSEISADPVKEVRQSTAPPWRNKELPPPPEKKQAVEKKANVHSGTTVKRYRPSSLSGKRRREAMTVKQEVEEEQGHPVKAAKVDDGVQDGAVAPSSPNSADETNKTVLFWAAQQDQFSHLPQLPDGWIRIPSKSAGQCYYVSLGCTFALNLVTGTSTFRSPLDLPPGWAKVISRSTGRPYYWHAEKQISQFDLPVD